MRISRFGPEEKLGLTHGPCNTAKHANAINYIVLHDRGRVRDRRHACNKGHAHARKLPYRLMKHNPQENVDAERGNGI